MLSRRQFLACAAALPVSSRALAGPLADPLPERASRLVGAAEAQIGVTLDYDPAYAHIGYPGGDVPPRRGVCADVIVRAYRAGLGVDLQRLVHEDMGRAFAAYPPLWGLKRPDSNIDHRRVPNLAAFFKRRGAGLAAGTAYRPGDLVTQRVNGHLPHIVLVAGRRVEDSSRYQVIHNIGGGTEYADTLATYPVTGHFRYL
ncbi:MAG: DUF1287 domain-containing protein [Parvibaculum sp.]|uniref:DUF1287 domain-containing protein n=1 Tax=Parvibaculum sp. TaxID=2024848 RepID=UPI0025D4997F|nr:DUF1287 domain-containing protein [Parvibaculum sp.]MCE9650828.1 DUF1287 domain-containing protein [Parvibaculum sp.]